MKPLKLTRKQQDWKRELEAMPRAERDAIIGAQIECVADYLTCVLADGTENDLFARLNDLLQHQTRAHIAAIVNEEQKP